MMYEVQSRCIYIREFNTPNTPMTSPTSNQVYHAEVKGAMQNAQAHAVYAHLYGMSDYGRDSLALVPLTGLPREAVSRALNDLYECRIPGLYVDYIMRPSDSTGRSSKHFYRVDSPPARARLSELLVAEGWRKDGLELWKAKWRIRKTPDGLFQVTDPELHTCFRGSLTPKNYRVILDAVMGGVKP